MTDDTRVVVLSHRRDLRGATRGERIVHGHRGEPADITPLFDDGRRVLLLFPREGAVPISSLPRAPSTLVVPTGSWSRAQKLARRVRGTERAICVRLDDERALSTDDAIARALAHLAGTARPVEREPRSATIEVLHNDDCLVVVNKSAGQIVHKGWARDGESTSAALARQLDRRVHPVHRLDRATSGALIFAKHPEVARDLGEMFARGSVDKRYLALVRGGDRALSNVDSPLDDKPAQTRFRHLAQTGRYGLFEARPITGRTHQIRRHLKRVSHPIIGDVNYGKGEHNRHFRTVFDFHRLALHCTRVAFAHPRTSAPVVVDAPLPADFSRVLERLEISWPPS